MGRIQGGEGAKIIRGPCTIRAAHIVPDPTITVAPRRQAPAIAARGIKGVAFVRLREPDGSPGLRSGIGRTARHAQAGSIAGGEIVNIGGRPPAETGVRVKQQTFAHFKNRIPISVPLHGDFTPGAGEVQQIRVNAGEGKTDRGQAGVGNGGEAGLRH